MEFEDLTDRIIGCAIRVHEKLGPGFLESVYHKVLVHEMTKSGLRFQSKLKIPVKYDNVIVGDFEADMLIENLVLIEIKAVQSLINAHEIQLVNYLTATQVDVGLLLNFGGGRVEVKRKHRLYRPKRTGELKEE